MVKNEQLLKIIETQATIDGVCSDLNDVIHADRIRVFQFKEEGRFTSGQTCGLMAMTYCLDKGLPTTNLKLQEQTFLMSQAADVLSKCLDGNTVWYPASAPLSSYFIQLEFNVFDINTVVCRGLFDKVGQMIGCFFAGYKSEYLDSEKFTVSVIKISHAIESGCQRISDVLTS